MRGRDIRVRSGLNATPESGPSESWWTSRGDIVVARGLVVDRGLYQSTPGVCRMGGIGLAVIGLVNEGDDADTLS